MIDREKALNLLHSHLTSQNLRRHCYSVEAVMMALASHFGEDEEKWGIVGLLHDADYELTKDNPTQHVKKVVGWLKEEEIDKSVIDAIIAHGYGYVNWCPEPKNNMEWSIYCCDELTGFIVAVTLVRPDKKIASVTVDSILKKWNQKAFAAAVNRDQIAKCEDKLGIPLNDFIEISLKAMQGISKDLGL